MRYASNVLSGDIEHLEFDVIIIGAGIAGLYTALQVDERYKCCILTKEDVEVSNSWLAQGGIAAAISIDDKPIYHFTDTISAGAGLCDEEAVKVLVSEGLKDIRSLVEMKVPFDLNLEGDLDITMEGGHHRRRIVHAGGDATGRETVKALAQLVSQRRNVTFMPYKFCADILTDEAGAVTGCTVLDAAGAAFIIDSANIVIATGGIGQVYRVSTNPTVATGDGIAAALRAGARLKGMEFIQFHPTGLWTGKAENRAFLISESLRGEGGLLKNSKGERFMCGQHELAELAPRDIVARGIVREIEKQGEDHVFVDITSKTADYLENRFPTIYHECLRRGLDISKEWIPVCPVQHYLIGGIQTDLEARTAVDGLFACGEAASTGVHGANRLASNSMLECLVFGRRAASAINSRLAGTDCIKRSGVPELRPRPKVPHDFLSQKNEIQKLMSEHCFVLRNEAGMQKAKLRISEILEDLKQSYYPGKEYIETLNIASIACCILDAAIERKTSVGAHYREDS